MKVIVRCINDDIVQFFQNRMSQKRGNDSCQKGFKLN